MTIYTKLFTPSEMLTTTTYYYYTDAAASSYPTTQTHTYNE